MKKRLYHPMLLVAALGLSGASDWAHADASAPVEHHIYLHVMPPKEGESVRVTVLPADTPAIAPVEEVKAEPKPEPAPPPAPPVEVVETEVEAVTETVVEKEKTSNKRKTDKPVAKVVKEIAEDIAVLPPMDAPPPAETKSIVLAAEKPGVPMGLLLFIFVLAIFLGFELIAKVPSQLHTPLMSGSNAISGITIVGALAAAGLGIGGKFGTFLGFLAVTFATINVVGGYMVTNRMLAMFQKKVGGPK